MNLADPLLLAIAPAVVALFSGLATGYYAGKQKSSLEYQKWVRGRSDDLAKEARLAVADLTRNLGAAIHAMSWLTWSAKYRANSLAPRDILRYDREIHLIFPAISGSLAIVSALSASLYGKMQPIVEDVFELDREIAIAGIDFAGGTDSGIDRLSDCHERVNSFYRYLNEKVADILQRHAQLDPVPKQDLSL
jgi:hypothetical protein